MVYEIDFYSRPYLFNGRLTILSERSKLTEKQRNKKHLTNGDLYNRDVYDVYAYDVINQQDTFYHNTLETMSVKVAI